MTDSLRHVLGSWRSRVAESARRAVRRTSPALQLSRKVLTLPVLGWHNRDVLTAPVRWRVLRWGDRPLAVALRLKPRMLSSRVRVARVPFRGSVLERIRLWLWEKHSVRAGIFLSVLLGVGMYAAAVGASFAFRIPMFEPQDDSDGIPTMIIATAAYLGGLFGFLQAVTIFAVQLRSQQDTAMLPLTPLIARRNFTFIILGAIAGVTIANLIAALAAPLLPVSQSAFVALSCLNLLAVPGATIAALWYLAKVVSEAGEADMDVALPILQATMRAQTHADALQVELLNQYGRLLDVAGITFDPFADSSLRASRATVVRIRFGKPGTIHDVDCHRLNRVARLLTTVPSSPKAAVTVAVGQSLTNDNALVLTWESPAPHRDAPSATALSHELQRKLGAALVGVLIVGREGDT